MQFRIRLIEANQQFFCDADQTIFAAALAHGLTMPSSCRNGTCRTCMCQLKSGQVRYQVEWPGLSFDEKQDGFILPCVAIPESDLEISASVSA